MDNEQNATTSDITTSVFHTNSWFEIYTLSRFHNQLMSLSPSTNRQTKAPFTQSPKLPGVDVVRNETIDIRKTKRLSNYLICILQSQFTLIIILTFILSSSIDSVTFFGNNEWNPEDIARNLNFNFNFHIIPTLLPTLFLNRFQQTYKCYL